MESCSIMSILVKRRSKKAPELQTILTKYGCMIRVRLGLHELENICNETGLILLVIAGDEEEIKKLESEINELDGITTKNMKICS